MRTTVEYQKSMVIVAREALRSLLASRPTTSVAELRELVSEHPSLGSVTLAELVGRGGAKAATGPAKSVAPKSAARPSKETAAKHPKARDKWNTHTDEGRAALDRAVLESLAAFGGVSVSAEALRARLGATPAQLRSSLNRHIEAGEVSFSGQARGTRYSLEG